MVAHRCTATWRRVAACKFGSSGASSGRHIPTSAPRALLPRRDEGRQRSCSRRRKRLRKRGWESVLMKAHGGLWEYRNDCEPWLRTGSRAVLGQLRRKVLGRRVGRIGQQENRSLKAPPSLPTVPEPEQRLPTLFILSRAVNGYWRACAGPIQGAANRRTCDTSCGYLTMRADASAGALKWCAGQLLRAIRYGSCGSAEPHRRVR